jgi:iron-sulfur cluster repair protein YtfE (RIC family)
MKPSQIRDAVLRDHAELRTQIDEIEGIARRLADGDSERGFQLWRLAKALLGRLEVHMDWEDRHLVPALRQADAWGDERAAEIEHDHAEQREMLGYVIRQLDDSQPIPELLAATMLDLVEFLRRDMEHEERDLLDPRVLRDDVIVIDANSG